MSEDLMLWLLNGQAALEDGRLEEAEAAFLKVRDRLPTDVSMAQALANVYRLRGEAVQSRGALLRAFADGDWSARATAFALGVALLEAGAPREAIVCLEQVLSSTPNDAVVLGALAGARRTAGQANAAWPLIQRAISASRDTPALLLTAAQIRHDLGDLKGAMVWLDRAERVRPNHAPTRLQRAYTSLLGGASRDGWALFDARPLPSPQTNARAWKGEPLDGTSILVTAEQGLGDQFQFARFAMLLGERGATRVVVECHADALSLFLASGFDAVARGTTVETDWHVPLMSLPHVLALGSNVCADRVPYLRSGESRAVRVPGSPRRLGLVWAGNPAFSGRVTRDFDVDLLSDVLRIPGIQWVSLQHGEAGAFSHPLLERIDLPKDWLSTARLLDSLDGLVTTDTGIVHLAGAMGIPTWTLLQFVPDWRWELRGDVSPWYPQMCLLRQSRAGDWTSVVAQLSDALTDRLSQAPDHA